MLTFPTGGVIILTLLLCCLFRWRREATISDIVRCRRRRPSTVVLDSKPQDARLTALPIYYESRYSVRSSMHPSQVGTPRTSKPSAALPPFVAKRFHNQNPYIKDTWKTASAPELPQTPRASTSFLLDGTPPRKVPESAEGSNGRTSRAHTAAQNSRDTTKSMRISIREALVPSTTAASTKAAEEPTPPGSPSSQRNLDERWSWTNSNAPPTPRYAPSLRSSISSFTRFRSIKSWTRGQSERIEEEAPPVSTTTKRLVLKNQASKPKLAPPSVAMPPKPHGRVGSLSSVFRQHPGTRLPNPGSPTRLEEQRPRTAPVIEMKQVSGS
jgi:hypothetical protein